MKKPILTAFFLLVVILTRAQTLSPTVLASSGDFFSNSSGMISWTLGELMGETYSSAGNFVTQGFQQPNDSITGIVEQNTTTMTLFPNPATDQLTLDFGQEGNGNYQVEVFNALGQQMSAQQITVGGGNSRFQIPVTGYADGIYFVRVRKSGSNVVTSFKINKVS